MGQREDRPLVSYDEGAALPMNYLTAQFALATRAVEALGFEPAEVLVDGNRLPPGLPSTRRVRPSFTTMVGVIELNMRLPAATAFASPPMLPVTSQNG